MFHHSMSRNQRNKGFTVKKTVQVALFLAVTLWLLYQIKHSFDKKADYAVEDQKKFPIGDGVVHMGRKGKTGSENIIGMDRDKGADGEPVERKDKGQGGHSKQTLGEGSGEKQDSQEDTTKHAEKQTKSIKEQQGTKNVDDDFKRNTEDEETKKDTTKGKEEVLQLPSQTDGVHSSDPVENGKGGKRTTEEITSSATEPLTSTENAKQNSDPRKKVDQLGNNATPGAEPSSNMPVDTQTSEGNKREAAGSQEGIASEPEVNGNSKVKQAANDAESDSQTNASRTKGKAPTEVNAKTRKDGDEVPTPGNNGKTEKDGAFEARNSDSQTNEAAGNDTKSEEELSQTLSPNPENNRVMPTNYEASVKDSVDTHVDNATHPDTQQKTLPTDTEQKSSGEINSQSGQKNDPSVKVS